MAQKSQIAKLIEAFSTNSKKTIAAAMETAKRLPIADMKKVVQGVKKKNPRAATRLEKALTSGKGTAFSRIVEAYNIKPTTKTSSAKTSKTAKKTQSTKTATPKQDDVLAEPPQQMAASLSQATDTTDLSVAPTRPQPVSGKRGRPKGKPDVPPEQMMLPLDRTAVMEGKGVKRPDGIPYEGDPPAEYNEVPFARKSQKTVQAAPAGQMATSTPEGEMFAAVNETLMSPSLAPNRPISLAEQQPSALSDLLNSGEFGNIPEAGLDSRGRTPLTPVGDARTAGMLTEGESVYPQAGVLEMASGRNVPPRTNPDFIRSSDPGTALSVIPESRTPPPVQQQYKAESIFPGQEQGFTVADTPEGNIRRLLTGPVDRTPPPVNASTATESLAPDPVTGPGVVVRSDGELIVPVDKTPPPVQQQFRRESLAPDPVTGPGVVVRSDGELIVPEVAANTPPKPTPEGLEKTANYPYSNAGGRFTLGPMESKGELVPVNTQSPKAKTDPNNMGNRMAKGAYVPPKSVENTEEAAKSIFARHPYLTGTGIVVGGPFAAGMLNAGVDMVLDAVDERSAENEQRMTHRRAMSALRQQVGQGEGTSLLESNRQMNEMFGSDLPEPEKKERPSKLKNKLEDTI